jgi:hypothetical protein
LAIRFISSRTLPASALAPRCRPARFLGGGLAQGGQGGDDHPGAAIIGRFDDVLAFVSNDHGFPQIKAPGLDQAEGGAPGRRCDRLDLPRMETWIMPRSHSMWKHMNMIAIEDNLL